MCALRSQRRPIWRIGSSSASTTFPFYTVTKPQVEQYGRWSYDNRKYIIVNMAIDGYPNAQAPYVGLPQETVDLIKADRATMLVDWVRVTR